MLGTFFVQLVLVEQMNLDRWKGMGMGMFSGISARDVQTIEVQVDGGWRNARNQTVGELPRTVTHLTQFPNHLTEAHLLSTIQKNQPEVTDVRVVVTEVSKFDAESGLLKKQILYETPLD